MKRLINFSFVIPVWNESQKQVDSCISFVRKAYPKIPILLLSDGGPDRTVQGCGYIQGEHLKEQEYGGAWVQRLFEIGLNMDTDLIIKIDPDTKILRPFTEIPNADFFGKIIKHNRFSIQIICGGCKGFSRQILQRALREKWFQDPIYKEERFLYKSWGRDKLSEDQVTSWAMFTHGIKFTDWPEIPDPRISPTDWSQFSVQHYAYVK